MPAPFAPEDHLILLLARGQLPPRVQEQVLALLATPLGWDLILERVTAQEVYPLFTRNLGMLGFPGVPAQVRAQLHNLSKINALRNTLMTEELVRVLTLLGNAGISTIPLKGVALAESLYGDISSRVCGDIDILVPRQQVCQAFRLLPAEGFEGYEQKLQLADLNLILDSNIEYSFVSRRQGFTILHELHWDIAWRWQRNGMVTDDLWAEAQPKTYWGAEGYGLSPEGELLYLAVHACRHQWQGLKWLVDIHEICFSSRIDWEKAREKAKRLGLEQVLLLTFSACHALLGTPIPGNFSLAMLPPRLKLFPAYPSPADVWKDNLFPIRLFRRPFEKLSYLARVAFLPTLADHRLIRLPYFLGFLYYLVRPLRLGCRLGSGLFLAAFEKIGL